MRTAIKVAVAVGVAATALSFTPGAQAATTYMGCPSGYVCMYPKDKGWNGGHPERVWYQYGSYNLSNVYGNHLIFNNQTGGAKFYTCTGYGGTGTCGYLASWHYDIRNFTPINSVKLTR